MSQISAIANYPPMFEGLKFWIRPDLRRVDGTGGIQSLTNIGGNIGGAVVQNTSTRQPTLTTLFGHPAILCVGSTDVLTTTKSISDFIFLHDGSGSTVFAIVDTPPNVSAAATGAVVTFNGDVGNVGFLLYFNGSAFQCFVGNGSGTRLLTATSLAVNPGRSFVSFRSSSAAANQYSMRIAGSNAAFAKVEGTYTGTPSSSNPTSLFSIGNLPTGGLPTFSPIGDVIIYDRYLSDRECEELEKYAHVFWGTP